MTPDVLWLAVIVGAFTYAFRFLPLWADMSRLASNGAIGRALSAMGPAAIATLFAAALRPGVTQGPMIPLIVGVATVVLIFWWRRSVVLATLLGAFAFGAVYAASHLG